LLRKQQKTLGGYFFLPHPVHVHASAFAHCRLNATCWSYSRIATIDRRLVHKTKKNVLKCISEMVLFHVKPKTFMR